MQCPRCQHENRPQAKFCEECASPLARTCPNCSTQASPTAKFCSECAQPLASSAASQSRFAAPDAYTPKHLAEKILTSKAALEGERKQVTVLFADLKGSMELLADRDPEEARKLLDPVLERMMEAVHRYEGTVNQVMGDGIMALFGAPVAHEDHAVRACYAALDMQEARNGYAEEVRRSPRHRGPDPRRAQLGRSRGARDRERSPHGLHGRRPDDPPGGAHGAARDPGTIVLTPTTLAARRRLRRGEVARPGAREGPRGAGRVVRDGRRRASPLPLSGARPPAGSPSSSAGTPSSSSCGRRSARAATGHGQVVALVGEPGVGKSRLVWEVTHSHRTHGWLILQASSVSYGTARPTCRWSSSSGPTARSSLATMPGRSGRS